MLGQVTGWNRLGIVLSVVWAIVVLVWVAHDFDAANRLIDDFYSDCISASKGNPGSCELMAERLRGSAYMNLTGRVLWLAFVLIPAAWLLAHIAVALWRWVRRGFHAAP